MMTIRLNVWCDETNVFCSSRKMSYMVSDDNLTVLLIDMSIWTHCIWWRMRKKESDRKQFALIFVICFSYPFKTHMMTIRLNVWCDETNVFCSSRKMSYMVSDDNLTVLLIDMSIWTHCIWWRMRKKESDRKQFALIFLICFSYPFKISFDSEHISDGLPIK